MKFNLQLFGGRGGGSRGGGGGVFGPAGASHTIGAVAKRANPNYAKGLQYQVNCQRVVYTAEMLRRGYNVEAKPAILNGVDKPANNWQRGFKNQSWEYTGGNSEAEVEQRVISTMKSFGPNARGIVYVAWKGGAAHVFNIETDKKGNVRAYDAQPGSTRKSLLHDYIQEAKTDSVYVSRVDNLNPNYNVMRGMMKRK